MTGMRQLGVGSQGGAEALAIFHQLIVLESLSGVLCENWKVLFYPSMQQWLVGKP